MLSFSIKRKLILGFSLLTLMIAAIAVNAWLGLNQLKDSIDAISENRLPKVEMANQILTNVRMVERILYLSAIYQTPESIELAKKEIQRLRGLNHEILEKLDLVVKEPFGLTTLDLIKKHREALSGHYKQYLNLMEQHQTHAAQQYLQITLAPSVKNLDDATREFVNYQQKRLHEVVETGHAEYNKVKNVLFTLVSLSLLCATATAVLLTRSITRPLDDLTQTIAHVTEHQDFTRQVPIHAQDEVGLTAEAFNQLLTTLRTTLGELQQSIGQVDNTTSQLLQHATDASDIASHTSHTATEMAAAVEEMASGIQLVTHNSEQALQTVRSTDTLAEEGNNTAQHAVSEIGKIGEKIQGLSSEINALSGASERISRVIAVIKDVAEQTNLLALNAAIEAARAGEAGRGFAVVADEVRQLAERTTQSTGEITDVVQSIQQCAQNAVSAIERTVTQVDNGIELAQQAGNRITDIRQSSKDVMRMVHEITTAIQEQANSSQAIAQQIEMAAQAAESSHQSAQQTAQAAADLGSIAQTMRKRVSQFQIKVI